MAEHQKRRFQIDANLLLHQIWEVVGDAASAVDPKRTLNELQSQAWHGPDEKNKVST